MHEARAELAEALFAGGLAYEGAGLLWAARANTLASTHFVHAEFREGGPIPDNAILCARKLIWLELQLGRVAHILLWMEFAWVIASSQGLDAKQKQKFLSERESQDIAFAMLLLKAELPDLMDLRFLLDVLERLGLLYSRMALLYALGYEDLIRSEGSVPPNESSEELLSTFKNLMKQATASDLPSLPTALGGGTLTYTSPVLGCRIVVNTDSTYESQRLGERILAGIEALFFTSLDEEIFPYREGLTIDIRESSTHQGSPIITHKSSGGEAISIVHGSATSDHIHNGRDWFLGILSVVLTKLVMLPDPSAYMERIFGEESGLARSVNFSESSIAISNLLGRDPKARIPDWNTDHNPQAYVSKRTTTWHDGEFSQRQETIVSEPKLGVGDVPEELLRRENAKHTERKVASLIDLPLWDKAKWKGAIYILSYELDEESWMAFGFQNDAAGRSIFEGWRARLGITDKEGRIRLSILTGIDRNNPHAYSIVVGSNLVERAGVRSYVSVSRIHRMEPSHSINLDRFRQRFQRVGTYRLMPGYIDVSNQRYRPHPDLAVQKSDIRICPAWQIQEHDPDAIANTTGIRTLAAITAAVPVRLMKRDLLFVAKRLASLLDDNRLAIVAKQYGIRKAKDSDSLGKLFAAYLRRAEDSVLGKVLVETTILYMATRHDPSQVLHDAAAVYKVVCRFCSGMPVRFSIRNGYLERSASVGSMDAARRAGMSNGPFAIR